MKKNFKKLISVLLAIVICFTTIPLGIISFAEEPNSTFNYVAIGDDALSGINTKNQDGENYLDYADIIAEYYMETKGFENVKYVKYSQSFYGSNEIRLNLGLDENYNVIPGDFQSANEFLMWNNNENKWMSKTIDNKGNWGPIACDKKAGFLKWNTDYSDGMTPKETIEKADLVTINMGTNDFIYYTIFRMLDMMSFNIKNYPENYLQVPGFAVNMTKEALKNEYLRMVKETGEEILAVKLRADI